GAACCAPTKADPSKPKTHPQTTRVGHPNPREKANPRPTRKTGVWGTQTQEKRQTQDPPSNNEGGAPKPKRKAAPKSTDMSVCATRLATSRGWRGDLFHRVAGHRCRAWLRRVLRWLRERPWRLRSACWP